jgi:branched-chain amino acid transport system permease protein
MLSFALTILLDGISYGMILFVISVGLTVTMGLMRVINLAHGSFAMIGGYVAGYLTQRGCNFYLAVLAAAVIPGLIGAAAEVTVYRPLYRKGELAQVLLTIGMVFVVTAAVTEIFGAFPYPVIFPEYLSQPVDIGFRTYPAYRLFLIVVGAVIAAVLWYVIETSLYGARLRAAVDNSRMARCVGMNVNVLFTATFALVQRLLAACRRARRRHSFARAVLRAQICRAVPGGGDRRRRRRLQGLVRGRHGARHHRHAGQIFRHPGCPLPALRRGVRPPAVAAAWVAAAAIGDAVSTPSSSPAAPAPATGLGELRLSSPLAIAGHALPWVLLIAFYFFAEGYLSLGTQVMVWILFALSLDLALGYAGIVTLGHAAFFGFGAYAAGLFAIRVYAIRYVVSFTVLAAALPLIAFVYDHWGFDTLFRVLAVTAAVILAIVSMLFEYANQARSLTGGDDGLQGIKIDPIFGVFEFNIFGQTAYLYTLVVLFL